LSSLCAFGSELCAFVWNFFLDVPERHRVLYDTKCMGVAKVNDWSTMPAK